MPTLLDLKQDLPPLCERFGIASVDVFGSLARGEGTDESDIDLVVAFTEPRRERISERFFGFLHALEDRYHRGVDLLTEGSIRNPFLLARIQAERVRIYGN